MAYHHALACISSPKVYIISRRLYPLSQWWYTRLSPWWYAKLRFDDMHACGVIWYVSSSLYKNSWKYLFCAMAKNKSARVIGCSREQRPQMEQGNGTKVIGGATLWRLCRQYHFAPVEKKLTSFDLYLIRQAHAQVPFAIFRGKNNKNAGGIGVEKTEKWY